MEATFDEDTTLIGNGNETDNNSKGTKGWQKVAIGGVTGIVLGSGSTLLMGMERTDNGDLPIDESKDNTQAESGAPSWAVGDIDIANSVNDDMKFGEAFATARAEVGPGGAFEWHGNVYATYNADEWNSMSAQDKAQFNDHFSWNHGHHSANHASHTNSYADNNSQNQENELEVVTAEQNAESHYIAQTESHTNSPETIDVVAYDSEVEVIGVMHDEETGSIVAGLNVYGQEAIIVDFDGDLTFDVLATDTNNNGILENNEVVDIQGAGITLDGLAGFMTPGSDILTSIDTPDITPDPFFDV